ncbi:MAG: helix-turn-helix domain-containing protein [Bacteroides sp.]|nr:helix-turn-helix domain-containing protein [Bacteroides sp.]
MSIGDRIKQRRKELKLTQPQLAETVGVSKGTIGNYESGLCSPNEKVLFKLFSALKCDANFLYQDNIAEKEKGKRITAKEAEMINKYRRLDDHGTRVVDLVLEEEYSRSAVEEKEAVPVLRIRHSFYKVSAGKGFDLGDEDEWEEIEIPDTPESRRADFALTIKGNSMEPAYFDGEIVLVKAQPAVDIGETGIFIVNGSGYIKKNGGDRLISVNPEYKDILFSEGDIISCAGKVIGCIS